MKNIKIHSLLFILISIITKAQVGINTNTPNPNITLDVNGKTNVTERIYLRGTDVAVGIPGNNKDVIVSSGPTNKPNWEAKKLPPGYGESFTLAYMNALYDEEGVDLTGAGTGLYAQNQLLDNDWHVINGFTTNNNDEFTLYKSNSKINLIFQTVPQITVTSGTGSASFACGLFINSQAAPAVFKLKAVRTDVVLGTTGSNKIFNMNVTLDGSSDPELTGSPAGNKYKMRVACRGRTLVGTGITFSIGKAIDTNVLNPQMARSALNIFVLEKW